MYSKLLNDWIILIIVFCISIDVILCERKKERFKFNVDNPDDTSGTPIQRGFKQGYFGAVKAGDKKAYAAAAARCAGEPTTKKILKAWDREDEGDYKEAGQACHKIGKEDENAKQAFVAGATVGATNALLKKGVNKLKLKEVPAADEKDKDDD